MVKKYHVYENHRARILHSIFPSTTKGVIDVYALQNISFDVRQGESVAIIGRNGSGKSTLLEIITGTIAQTAGSIHVNGQISALLELGSGFNPEFTGRENVFLNGLLMGLSRSVIERRFNDILSFAEIGDVLDRPVKTYSSGMLMRLAFSVQVALDPDILIVDEALGVGDFFFQQKCFARIRELQEAGKTILFVSHDMGVVRDLCQRAIYLRNGYLQYDGTTSKALNIYFAEQTSISNDVVNDLSEVDSDHFYHSDMHLAEIYRHALWKLQPDIPEPEGKILAVALYGCGGSTKTTFTLGEDLTVVVVYVPPSTNNYEIIVGINNKYNQLVTATGSAQLGINHPPKTARSAPLIFELKLTLLLEAGSYSLHINLGFMIGPNKGGPIDNTPPIGPIQVAWNYEKITAPFLGPVGLPSQGRYLLQKEAP